MALLDYENQIFLDAFHSDGLLIMAKGMGIHRVFTKFLKFYCDPEHLVLVLNTSLSEEESFINELHKNSVTPLPKSVTNEFSSSDRERLYLEGGVLFVSTRILVVDMLTEKIPIELIAGILVYKAHRIMESSQAAFILRLFRKKNKHGFIKAFSESPLSFTSGFCQVERVMRNMFIRKLLLWPRFHARISSCLNRYQVDVVEIRVSLTSGMSACQAALLELIDACIKELQRCNPVLEAEELNVENALTRGFDKIIKTYMDPTWHLLGPKTKQLVADIKTLRSLLEYLTQHDCVHFFKMVQSIQTNEKSFGKNSGWMFLDAADTLFMNAAQRVYGDSESVKKRKTESTKEKNLEVCPKWETLQDILKEVKKENKTHSIPDEDGRLLIVAYDTRTCRQITKLISEGKDALLESLVKTSRHNEADSSKEEKKRPGWENMQTLTQMIHGSRDRTQPEEVSSDSSERVGDYNSVTNDPVTFVEPLYASGGFYSGGAGSDVNSLVKALHQLQPRYVVLYDPDMKFVRQLEVFRATRPTKPLRVYFIIYTDSVEEQRYLTTLRKEKEAFEYLIKQKASMVLPEEDNFEEELEEPMRQSSRRGGVQSKSTAKRKIVIDMREFRSELPSLIHRRGIEIEPVTLEVGDYILTPDICVERKSVSDLIGSLNNGRLYNQAQSMCRFYKRPVLLIEFDANKPFVLQDKYYYSSDISSYDTSSRLTLLTIHFPRLRILWCQSPYATAELFDELKLDQLEPDAAVAMAMSSGTDRDVYSFKYNASPQDMLHKMPGVSSKNIYRIMNHVTDLAELSALSQEKLTGILESEVDAKQLWTFLHQQPPPPTTAAPDSTSNNIGGGKVTKRTTLMKSVKRKR